VHDGKRDEAPGFFARQFEDVAQKRNRFWAWRLGAVAHVHDLCRRFADAAPQCRAAAARIDRLVN
jgi:hypothetical protein